VTTAESEVEALLRTAQSQLDSRDAVAARRCLESALKARPRDMKMLMLLGMACRMQGDHRAALGAINRALAVEPYSYVAHLSKGAALEELGKGHAAAESYKAALALAPPPSQVQKSLLPSLRHAERAVRRDAERLHAFLSNAVAAERGRYAGADLKRFDECMAIFAGRARRYVHEAALLYFPQLPATPFYDDALFPWLPQLEQATDMIREELMIVLQEDARALHPYIQYPAGAPVRQWKQLNHSPAWSAYDLWRDGRKIEQNCRRCPNTTALLEDLPMAIQDGYGPTAMFSVLAPHTHIPPHTGSTNIRLIVHLPLILPPQCRYRVGNDRREWRMGKAWVFDDTIEHEAWNDSDETRVILMFDVWNPLLTEAERALVTTMMLAKRRFE
jgi:hypothetical protein